MKIGIVGVGMVGGALSFGFCRIGHDVVQHDIKLETSIEDVLTASVVFVCVPTPQAQNGACDTSKVEDVVNSLASNAYIGLVVIKSTVTPGTTDRLRRECPLLRLAFCPEFLRERAAMSDFVDNQDVCIAGVYDDADYGLIRNAHGSLPKQFVMVRPLEAEFAKYFSNTFNALRIVFANQFYDVCTAAGANYTAVKNAVIKRTNIGDHYLECNSHFRSFGGSCLPKDTAAFAKFARSLGVAAPLFSDIVDYNNVVRSNEKK